MLVNEHEKHTKLLILSDICNKNIFRLCAFCDNQ